MLFRDFNVTWSAGLLSRGQRIQLALYATIFGALMFVLYCAYLRIGVQIYEGYLVADELTGAQGST
jgi:hypothetical protein